MSRVVSALLVEWKPVNRRGLFRLFSTSADKPILDKEKDRYPGYDKRTIYGEEYPIWHKPLTERPEEFKSKFSLLSLDRIDFTKMQALDETLTWPQRFQKWYGKHIEDMEIEDQLFNPTRLKMLGADLATAHFICYRGGAVKFVNDDKWIRKVKGKFGFEVELPPRFVPGMYLEAVDCENFVRGGVRYEGFENMINLERLTWLSFRNCTRFNDWSMDKISSIVNETVEYLDIRGTKATYRGLSALSRFKNLKLLLVDFQYDESEADIVEQTYALLQQYHKDLLIKVG